jgi:hypothetical protein
MWMRGMWQRSEKMFQMEEIDVDARDVRGVQTPLYSTVCKEIPATFLAEFRKKLFQIDVDARDVRGVKTPLYSTVCKEIPATFLQSSEKCVSDGGD